MSRELKKNYSPERKKLMDKIPLYLGGGMVDIELDNPTLNLAIDTALDVYRQRAENSVEENYIFMELTEHQNDYILPNEISEVRQIYRRGFGISTGNSDASMFDPFEVQYVNYYLGAGSQIGDLASYELYTGNLELAGTMFGYHMRFDWNNVTKRLKIHRNLRSKEEILLWAYTYIPEEFLLKDIYAGMWLTKYATAEAKRILGDARSKFPSLAGPQGGVSLNGDAMKSEAMQEKSDLEEQLKRYGEGSKPLSFILG